MESFQRHLEIVVSKHKKLFVGRRGGTSSVIKKNKLIVHLNTG